jgi:hypothetical protein
MECWSGASDVTCIVALFFLLPRSRKWVGVRAKAKRLDPFATLRVIHSRICSGVNQFPTGAKSSLSGGRRGM